MNRPPNRLVAVLAVSLAFSAASPAVRADSHASSPFPPSARWQPPTSKDYVSDSERKPFWRPSTETNPSVTTVPYHTLAFPPSARWQPPTSKDYASDFERKAVWRSGDGTGYSKMTSCGSVRTGAMPSGGFPLILLPIILPVVLVAAAASSVNAELCNGSGSQPAPIPQ